VSTCAQVRHTRIPTPAYDTSEFLKAVASSAHQMPNWHDPLLTSKEQLLMRTNCTHTARYVISYFTDMSYKEIIQQFKKLRQWSFWDKVKAMSFTPHATLYRSINTPYEFWNTLDNFFRKKGSFFNQKESPHYRGSIATRLFARSTQPEHVLFYVNLGGGGHVFVIEKMCDGIQTWWRVYQSFYSIFTLAEWLGLPGHPWRLDNQDTCTQLYTHLFKIYGKNQQITDPELIAHFITYNARYVAAHYDIDEPQLSCYVKMFDITK